MELYFAPLEGVGGYTYRNIQIDLFGGADKYFAPFVSPSHNPKMAGKEIRDILPENNKKEIKLIPQILASNPEYFIKGAMQLYNMGYEEINFNAGCPSGTVVSKGKGAGFLRNPEKMDEFFYSVFDTLEKINLKIDLSVKTRIGVEDKGEFEEILEVYNKYKFLELIIHPRTKVQLYKGEPDMETFSYAYSNSSNKLCYNGNINSVKNYQDICDKYKLESVMIGRGALQNPNIFNEIKGRDKLGVSRIDEFQKRLYEAYMERIGGEKQVLLKMKELWSYLALNFEDEHKVIKMIRKAQNINQYNKAMEEIFGSMELK